MDVIFIAALIVVIFAVDLGRRWWRENEWSAAGAIATTEKLREREDG